MACARSALRPWPRIRSGAARWLLFPALAFTAAFFLLPMAGMVAISFHESSPERVYLPTWSVASYVRFLGDPWYLGLLWRTVRLAAAVTAIVVLVGYPLSYWIWRARGWSKALVMAAVLVPLFTNIIARLYGWQIVLSKGGPVNWLLVELGWLERPVLMNYNLAAVMLGMVHIALPYFVLILVSALEGIEPRWIEVARNLGAGRLRSVFQTIVPLSAPGFATATAVAFAWGMGAYAEPIILGAPKYWTMSVEAERQILSGFDWPFGTSIAFLLVAAMLLLIGLLLALLRHRRPA